MPDEKRWKAYLWVTHLTKLLSGEHVCEWAAWYKAHFRYTKLEREEGDLDAWKIEHDAMVRHRVARLDEAGWRVRVEDQNSFKLEGEKGTLAGKPDIIALRGPVNGAATHAVVIDEKSGQRRESDTWQVLIYLWVLPRLGFRTPTSGEVEYKSGTPTVIDPAALNVERSAKIRTLLQTVFGDLEPPKSPSANECKFCDIAACPARIQSETIVAETKDF